MAEDIVNSLGMIREELEKTRTALQKEEAQRTKSREAYDKAKMDGDRVLQKSLNTDLMQIGKRLSNLNKVNASLLTDLSETQTSSLEELTEKFSAQRDAAQFDLSTTELGNQIKALNKDSNENSMELKALYEQSIKSLEDPQITDEERQLAMDQIEALKGMASSEEETREARRLQEEANSRLLQMAEGIDSFADGFDRFSDNFKKGAGLLGTLGAIGMLLFSPETLKKMIDDIITFIEDMITAVKSIINGDWTTALDLMKEHIVGIGVAIAGFAAIFGGSIMRGFSSVLRTVKSLGQAVSKMGKLVGKLFLPITIAMGAFAVITGFIEGFKEGGLIGGIQSAITNLFDTLIAAPLDMIKDLISWALGKLGFENAAEMLDSFSFSDLFASMFDSIFSFIGKSVDWVKGLFSEVDVAGTMQSLWEGLVGEGGLFDILFKPIDMAINWVMGIFGFEAPEGGFSLRETIGNVVDQVIDFFTQIFDFLPSLDSVVSSFKSILPSWLGGSDDEESPLEPRAKRIISEDASEARTLLAETKQDSAELISSTATPGRVLESSNQMMDKKAEAANNTIIAVQGGGGKSGGTNNVTTSTATYNISQGVTADDFVRRDFLNSY